jgi:hypothetical protein
VVGVELGASVCGGPDSLEIVLEGDAVGFLFEGLAGEPSAMAFSPRYRLIISVPIRKRS